MQMLNPVAAELERVVGATRVAELFALAVRLGRSITGEHGVGLLKRSHLGDRLGPAGQRLNAEIKRAFDPKGLLNPGKG